MKKVLSVAMAGMLALSLTACGSSEKPAGTQALRSSVWTK